MNYHKRKPNRLINYDYSQNGAYFVTICTKDRRETLWEVGARIARPKEEIVLSNNGLVIESAILNIPQYYPSISIDNYVIMPNHIHMILVIATDDGRAMRAPTIATVINQMKGYVTKKIGFSLWQKLYHDRIIRDTKDYLQIWEYIDTNSLKWEEDCFYENEY